MDSNIQKRQLCHLFRADADLGMKVAKALGMNLDPAMLSGPIRKQTDEAIEQAKPTAAAH